MSTLTRPRVPLLVAYGPTAAGGIACLLGSVVLLGWATETELLSRLAAEWRPMKPNTAASFIIAGLSLLAIRDEKRKSKWQRAGRLGGVFVACVGAFTLFEHITGRSLGIDDLVLRITGAHAGNGPIRMSMAATIGLLALGLGLCGLDLRTRRGARPFQALFVISGAVGLLGFAGYLYDVTSLYRFTPFSGFALLTAICFVVLSIGSLCLRSGEGPLEILTDEGLGGTMVRRLLPIAVAAPLTFGWILLRAQNAGTFGMQMGLAIFAIANIGIFTVLIWATAVRLRKTDTRRRRAESAVREREESLQAAQARAHIGSWELDLGLGRGTWSPEMFRLFQRDPALGEPSLAEFMELVHVDDRATMQRLNKQALDHDEPVNFDFRTNPASGSRRYYNVIVKSVRVPGQAPRLGGTIMDITERKTAEIRIQHLNRVYAVLSNINEIIVRERDTERMFGAACQAAVEKGGFRAAWVGMVDPAAKRVRIAARAGHIGDYLDKVVEILADNSGGNSPNSLALRTGNHVVFNDVENMPEMALREEARRLNFRAIAAFPLKVDGVVCGVFGLYSPEANFFDEAELRLLDELAMDLSFALKVSLDDVERRRVEESLRASEERFRQLAENIEEVFWISDATGEKFHYVSPAYARIWGRSCESLLDQPESWRSAIHPDDLDRMTARASAKAFKGTYDEEYRVVRPDASIRWIRDRAFPVRDAQGNVFRLVGVAEDISQRKQADEELRRRDHRFRLLIENASDIITVLEPDGKISYQSPSTSRVLGYDPKETAGRNVMELIHPEDAPRVKAALLEGIAKPGAPVKIVFRFKQGATNWRIFESVGQYIEDFAGKSVHVVNSRDVTESRKLEEQFRQAQKMEAIGTLAGGIAHDFNNILGAISGYTELAQMCVGQNSEVFEHLAAVSEASKRAADLVRQILAFSRQQEPSRHPVQLHHAIADSLKLLRATLPSTIELTSSLPADVPTVLADLTQIHQIVMNLGTNAWHAMKNRMGRLEVTLENFMVDAVLAEAQPGLQTGRYARLTVSDNGSGMDAATAARIFEPFFTTKAPGEGTGLGLSVVHGIVQSHDGAISVYSQPGEGTTFHLYFPIHGAEASSQKVLSNDVPRGNGERILFVDDEAPLARLGEKTLRQLGYVVESRTSAAAAIQAVRADPQKYDLIVTDQTMPEITGTDLTKIVLNLRPELKVILTTGYAGHLPPSLVADCGARELLLKPFTLHSLGEAVHRVLRERRIH